jgi:hypothetical protein
LLMSELEVMTFGLICGIFVTGIVIYLITTYNHLHLIIN